MSDVCGGQGCQCRLSRGELVACHIDLLNGVCGAQNCGHPVNLHAAAPAPAQVRSSGLTDEDWKRLEQMRPKEEPKVVAMSEMTETRLVELLTRFNVNVVEWELPEMGEIPFPRFNWSDYKTEAEGTPHACKHLQTQLQNAKAPIGRHGFKVVDARSCALHVDIGTVSLSGYTDAAVTVNSVAKISTIQQTCMIFEFKCDLAKNAVPQILAEIFGATIQSHHEVLGVLTDLRNAILFRFGGVKNAIMQSPTVSMSKAMPILVDYLKQTHPDIAEWHEDAIADDDTVGQIRKKVKRFDSSLIEQLESLDECDRVDVLKAHFRSAFSALVVGEHERGEEWRNMFA